mgnify:CR=1 FL=1
MTWEGKQIWRVEMDFEDWHGTDARYFIDKEVANQFVAIIKKLEPGGRRFTGMHEVITSAVQAHELRDELWYTMELLECKNCGWYEAGSSDGCDCEGEEE